MELYQIENGLVVGPLAADSGLPESGYGWLDLVYDEAGELAERVYALTGVRIYDDHVDDVRECRPSVVVRQHRRVRADRLPRPRAGGRHGTERITTVPMFLFNFDRLLVTVRHPDVPAVAQVKSRFLSTAPANARRTRTS